MNHAAEYAIRASVYLAQHCERRATAAAIAEALALPRNYLSKVLHTMAQAGLLTSTRGPHGGFRLNHAPEQLTLARVTEPFRHDVASPVWWRGVSDQMASFLNTTTVQMLLERSLPASAPPGGGAPFSARSEFDGEAIGQGGSYVKQRRAQ